MNLNIEETFVAIDKSPPSGINRLARVFVSILAGTIAGCLAGYLVNHVIGPTVELANLLPFGGVAGLVVGTGIGLGLAKFDELTLDMVLSMVGYVLLGMGGYGLLFALLGLMVGGGAGGQAGLMVGLVVGTAVGLFARLIKYRYRHF